MAGSWWFGARRAALTIAVGAGLLAFVVPGAVGANTTSGVSAPDLAAAMSGQSGLVAGATYVPLSSPQAVAVSDDTVGGMPRDGVTYAVLSSGGAGLLTAPNNSGSSGVDLNGPNVRGTSDYDVTILRLDLQVPASHNCLSVDFRFLSEEYPEYVGTAFNDAFLAEVMVAELDSSTWTTSGSEISAPDNFAFDPEGNPITINAAGVTSMTAAEAAGTTYDGSTPLLVASTPITPGQHRLFLSIFDQGDQVYDSTVLLDHLRTYAVPSADACRPGAELAGNRAPVWEDWHLGDVHVHAAGDTNLLLHPRCSDQTEETCAQYLVQNVLDRAQRFGAEWLVFTEHGPWLGFQRDANVALYDAEQAEQEWNFIRQALDDQSSSTIRGLMGAELGTAIPACTDVDIDVDAGVDIGWQWPPVQPDIDFDFSLRSPGHFGVYAMPSFIDQSIFDCNETGENGYADDTREVGGWGGINHPDNENGGSPWWCYSSESADGGVRGAQEQPQHLHMDRCPIGIDAYGVRSPSDAGSFRTMEIISGPNVASAKTLGTWDMFLQNGYRISAVGGGDGHTAPRKQDVAAAVRCIAIDGDSVGECVDAGSAPSDGNHDKVAGSGRTIAYYPDGSGAGGPGYSSTDLDDPARVALRDGRTVATNGPVATAQLNGQFPGATVSLPGDELVPLRVDWRSSWSAVGDTVENDASDVEDGDFDIIPGPGEEMVPFTGEVPDRIVVVTGERDGCGWDRFHCADSVDRRVIDIEDGATSAPGVTLMATDGIAEVMVDPPADGYVRVELYWDVDIDGADSANDDADHDDGDEPRFLEGGNYDFAAYTSPIYVERTSTATIVGQVVDGPTGQPVGGAAVELCRTDNSPVCVTRTTRPDGTFVPVVSPVGTWTARAFPPAGVTDRGIATAVVGTLAPGATGSVTLTLPFQAAPPPWPFIDPSGTVVDPYGNPVAGATVVLSAAADIDGPFAPLPDGSAVMSPSNRVNPDVTGDDGTFAWDVLAGWYEVSVTKPGCRAPDGDAAASSGPLQVPPPALGIELVLDCRPPDADGPVITVSGVPEFTRQQSISVSVALDDASPALAFCVLDGGPAVDVDGVIDGELDLCLPPTTFSNLAEGPHTLTVFAVDDRDNLSVEEVPFVVDTIAPNVTVSGVEPNSEYVAGAEPAPACSAEDEGSGLAEPCTGTVSAPPGGVGTWTYTATATDRAGNLATASVSWKVIWPFDGFLDPVVNLPEVLEANAGQAIPVKFGLGGDHGLGVLVAGSPTSAKVTCHAAAEVTELAEAATPGASGLSYDPATQAYTYVWKTQKAWARTCREFRLVLVDGTTHAFVVKLR